MNKPTDFNQEESPAQPDTTEAQPASESALKQSGSGPDASPGIHAEPPSGNDTPSESELPEIRGNGNLDLLKSLFLGALATAVFYEVFPLPFMEPGRLLSLFENRVSEVIVGMTLWSLFLLLFKYLHHRRQHRVYLAFLRPEVRSLLTRGIYARNARQAQQAIDAVLSGMKLSNHRNSVIFRRVTRLLQLSRSAPKKEGLNELLDYQAQLDVKRLEISYSILHVFLWAIPILGFIGTVMGIGSSVGEFAGFIQTAEGGAQFGIQMRTALSGVTSGLAVAFNTTFLALVLVIPVMLLTSFLSKSEEELLLGIEEFCLEDLLPHLHITPGEDALAEGFEEHMHRILRLSDTWLGQFGPLVSNLSSQTQSLGAQMAGIQPVIREFTDRLLETGPASAPEAGRSADRSSGPGSTGTTLEEAPPSARAQADPARDGNEEETTGQG